MCRRRRARRQRRFAAILGVALVTVRSIAPAEPAAGEQAAPDPVIVIGGVWAPEVAHGTLVRRLVEDGRVAQVFAWPVEGSPDIRAAARVLAGFVAGVRAERKAGRVDLIAHSAGGLVMRYFVEKLGGAGVVDSAISLGSPHRGSYVAKFATLLGLGRCFGVAACRQMAVGSSFLDDLNGAGETAGEVEYTNFYTVFDQLVLPVWNAAMETRAINVKIQSQCSFHFVEHFGLIYDATVYTGIRDALEHRPVALDC